jgi:hypothetical protein
MPADNPAHENNNTLEENSMFLLGTIISMLCSVWFYRTAVAKGAPAVQWAIVGFVSYLLTNLIWTFWVAKPIATKLLAQNAGGKAGVLMSSGVLIGALVAWLVWSQLLNKLKPVE